MSAPQKKHFSINYFTKIILALTFLYFENCAEVTNTSSAQK